MKVIILVLLTYLDKSELTKKNLVCLRIALIRYVATCNQQIVLCIYGSHSLIFLIGVRAVRVRRDSH